jgi:hypothetical protein
MDKDRDLLPWIMGGLSMATVAIAITVVSTQRIVPANLQSLGQTATQALPAASLPGSTPPPPAPISQPATTTVPAPTPEPSMPAEQIQTAGPPPEQNGQIWECTINGQKTFSSNPCGDRSSLREIGPINGMEATPIPQRARSYAPESSYRPEYSYPTEQPYPTQQDDPNPSEQGFAGNAYPVYVGIPFREHRRADHDHRPHSPPPHNSPGSPPRRN